MVTRDSLGKHLALAFGLALAFYLIGFAWVEHRRTCRGPWEVTFVSETQSPPRLVIHQPSLDITNVVIEFEGVSGLAPTNATIRFDTAREVPFPVPFGECVFLDPLFLPGTVTLQLFGHQVEMLPRTLSLDGQPHAWGSAGRWTVQPTR